MCYSCYANGFQFHYHLANFRLFFFTYFQAYLSSYLCGLVSVKLAFTFYV